MFRRRPLRAAGPRVRQAVRLLARGRYGEAADRFAELADRASDGPNPLRAARLSVQAARAYVEAGDGDRALPHLRRAADQFIAAGRGEQTARTIQRALSVLRARGFMTQADALEREVQTRLDAIGLSLASASVIAQSRGRLPGKCPKCGGPLRSEDVDWIDAVSVECPFCGNTVVAH